MQNVGTSDRFSDAIEVLPMTQWFIDVNKKIPEKDKSLKDLMREAVTTGHNGDKNQRVKITPERFEKIYLNCAIGAFLVKFGGDIEFQFGIKVKKYLLALRRQMEKIGSKMKTL